ncbi:hypothetical protein L3C95_11220 [Chitinophaga filiformis]|uniref:hypothetical protein n=1 Tax=Chitinophaga filiformis TaxID=104663 RepID=UPI001F40FD41|nr:hypothetical protein [Chitinophaga filiformis]MCF6402632.1 hypothetical protein [Chitinophaga filiformis]MCF6403450.1 hypothetical protein [Chitinophaga filiformis]
MARTKNPLLTGVKLGHGKIAPGFVLKTRKGKVFISKCPDMSNVVPSKLQLKSNSNFTTAIEYARSIINDPVKKAAYKIRRGMSVYHSAVKDYLESH